MAFQVRVTDADWLAHLKTIEDLQFANFWTGAPNPRNGERIIFLRGGKTPRKIAGWGFVHSSGEATPDYYWDAMDSNGITSSSTNSQAASKKYYMILRDVHLLGSRAPLETDFFNEEYGLEVFPLSGPGTKNYTVDFPVDFEDRDVVEILADRSEIGAKEGGKRYVTHVQIERNHRHLRARKISASKELNDGKVPCEVCDLDMLGRYNMDVPIIECHHLFPLSELDGEEVETTLDDLALLCPSCHRAIHKLDDCSDLDELRRRLNR